MSAFEEFEIAGSADEQGGGKVLPEFVITSLVLAI
jgi:hypothetical protein